MKFIGERSELMKGEVQYTLKKIKSGKATGPDGISVERITALENVGIEAITSLLNKICSTGNIPADMIKSIFIVFSKKPRSTECGQHQTISLMSQITKLLLRIILVRIRGKIRHESWGTKWFIKGKGTANTIYILRTIADKAAKYQKICMYASLITQ